MAQHTSSGSPPHVAVAIDSNMVFPLAILLSSLSAHSHTPPGLTMGYLEGALDVTEREFLSAVCEHLGLDYQWLELGNDPRFINQGHISPTTFAKFLLADAIKESHLWLDADTVVLPGWEEIFALIQRAKKTSGLVVARRDDTHADPPAQAEGALPFNAGVLGWPKRPRKDWSSVLTSLEEVATQEQYLFNKLYAPEATWVSEKFNMLTYRTDRLSSESPPFIIHYAGAHKPWHLPRTLAGRCLSYHCPWSEWFRAEQAFLTALGGTPLHTQALGQQKKALSAGKIRWQRDHAGLVFIRLLRLFGPAARPLLWLLSPLRQWVPRGTHPIH